MSEANPNNPKIPEIPAELWMLWTGHGWLVSVDEPPGGATYLIALSEAEAIAASQHQRQMYGVETTPARVDGTRPVVPAMSPVYRGRSR
jgi:hypothetical protein